ncbi:ribonuclease P, partial [Xanthomonas euvesicatoria]
MAVSRKVDTRAVGRNRIKRVLRDAMRHLLPELAGGDYV